MGPLQDTETGKKGHFWRLHDCLIEERLCTRKIAPPPKIGRVHNLPLTEERLITLSIRSSCRKFTGSKINCTIFEVFFEEGGGFFSLKTFSFLLSFLSFFFHFFFPLLPIPPPSFFLSFLPSFFPSFLLSFFLSQFDPSLGIWKFSG